MAFGAMCKSIKIYVKYCNFYLCGHRIVTIRHNLSAGELVLYLVDGLFFLVRQLTIYICLNFFSVYVGFDSPTKKNSISEVQNQLWHELEYLFIVRSPRQARSAVNNDKKREERMRPVTWQRSLYIQSNIPPDQIIIL